MSTRHKRVRREEAYKVTRNRRADTDLTTALSRRRGRRRDVPCCLLAGRCPRYLAHLRRFFSLARAERLVLVDPTARLEEPKGDRGSRASSFLSSASGPSTRAGPAMPTCPSPRGLRRARRAAARLLLGRAVQPRPRGLRSCQRHAASRTPPAPLDPRTTAALAACLAHCETLHTLNRHVTVTRLTAASLAFAWSG